MLKIYFHIGTLGYVNVGFSSPLRPQSPSSLRWVNIASHPMASHHIAVDYSASDSHRIAPSPISHSHGSLLAEESCNQHRIASHSLNRAGKKIATVRGRIFQCDGPV